MNRSQFEHIVRACGAITSDNEFIVIGSQSLLGKYPDAAEPLLRSMDLDLYPKNRVEESAVIDGAIGEVSIFHQTFGYYAHGVGPETAILPEGWRQRLIPVCNENTRGVTGWCLDPADLAVSKLAAGRETDYEFVRELFLRSLVDPAQVKALVAIAMLSPEEVERITAFLDSILAKTTG